MRGLAVIKSLFIYYAYYEIDSNFGRDFTNNTYITHSVSLTVELGLPQHAVFFLLF